MSDVVEAKRIAIIGGGPAGLFMYKRLLDSSSTNFTVDIFEATGELGAGMPYSYEGANVEHVTNVSSNEIPSLVTDVIDWLDTLSQETVEAFNLDREAFHEFKVMPRLLFGKYLGAQFKALLQQAQKKGPATTVHLNTRVSNIVDDPQRNIIYVEAGDEKLPFDHVIICTGHNWPLTYEGKVAGYFDSPYPPSKLAKPFNHPVAVRGSSLTAIDAIRTLARNNGTFIKTEPHKLTFQPHAESENFKIIMHSKQGLLPAVRFHLDHPHLSKDSLLTKEEIAVHIEENDGFLSLDFIFEKDFKDPFREKDPEFFERIRNLRIEEFVETMMEMRERVDPFLFLKGEYAEAKKSIRRKESVYWKEALAVLSFAMNYPAKHLSAEDMRRLKSVLMPLISIVIAFVPQASCEELIALYDAGRLELVAVGQDSNIEIDEEGGIVYHFTDDDGVAQQKKYNSFIDSIGQRPLSLAEFPFQSLAKDGTISGAWIRFRSPEAANALLENGNSDIIKVDDKNFYLKVPGIAISDSFRALDKYFASNPRVYIMAVPYIGGFNPDYSGLDFCEEASKLIVEDLFGIPLEIPE